MGIILSFTSPTFILHWSQLEIETEDAGGSLQEADDSMNEDNSA